MNEEPTIDEMIRDLERLGWKRWRNNPNIWEAPWGDLYRGPYRAWTIATKKPDAP